MGAKNETPKGVPVDQLPAEIRAQLGLGRAPRQQRFSVEQERRHAIRVLAVIADIDQGQRARVLRRAVRMNEV